MAKNEWENDDSFFESLYSVYKKLGQFFSILGIHCSVASYKYFKKLLSEV